jgi:hypothetical protein
MHRDYLALRHLDGVSRGLRSKQFVTELHDEGFTRDQAMETLCQVFGVPRHAAVLFVDSHPAWASEARANEPHR